MPSANFADASVDTVPSSATAEQRRNLSLRVLSAVALAPPVLVLAWLGGLWFGIAVALTMAVALREWLRAVSGKPFIAGYIVLFAGILAYWRFGAPVAIAWLLVFSFALGVLARSGHRPNPWFGALGLPYVGFTMVALPWVRDSFANGWHLVLFVFLVVWASDIGAFAVGRTIGGPKLAPAVSPNKTWSGLVGGLGAAAAVAFGWAEMLAIKMPAYAIMVAIGLSLVGQGGDLFESAVKRRFQLKDSGGLIPGHGGLLDRIDGLLWAAPVFALFCAFGGTADLMP